MTNLEIANMIDHTILKATATLEDVEKLCQEAIDNKFASVCINPCWVKAASEYLKANNKSEHQVKTCTVIGFPLGANTKSVKVFETKNAVENGAEEIDMVINIGLAKMGSWELIEEEIAEVVKAAEGNCVKVILENCYLTEDEIKLACEACVRAKASFVKTSTGFGTYGAKPEDVKIMREVVGENLGVKAAGGIRDKSTTIEMIEAGANRIGCSAGIQIISE